MLGIEPLQALSRHRENELLLVEGVALEFGGDAPVPEHRRAVADRQHFRQPMRDQDHRLALLLQQPQDGEQAIDLKARQRSGRLIQHQHAGLKRKRARDHHQMALRGGEAGGQHVGPNGEADLGEQLARLLVEQAAVDDRAAPEAHLAGEDVFGDGELLEDLDLLRHVADALRAGVGRGVEPHRRTVDADFAGIAPRDMHAVEDFHERRFARAVLADQRMDLAGMDREIDAAQRLHAAEILDDPADRQDGAAVAHLPLSPLEKSRRAPRARNGGLGVYCPALSSIL